MAKSLEDMDLLLLSSINTDFCYFINVQAKAATKSEDGSNTAALLANHLTMCCFASIDVRVPYSTQADSHSRTKIDFVMLRFDFKCFLYDEFPMRAPAPLRETKSESGSNPPSTRSSPRIQSPASSPGHPSKPWKFPSHSRDPSVERISGPLLGSKHSTPKNEPSSSLFDIIKAHPQPWNNSPKKNNIVPGEQTERYQRTFTRVVRAVSPMISDLAGDMTHEMLMHGAELLKFAPIPGLEGAAKVLVAIWDAIQKVETNRLACLRLTERCADILIAIQEEISGLDKRVADALYEPMEKLEDAFREIESMMLHEIHQSPIRRYFKRDEVLEGIVICNTKLQDCLGHFDRSINLRVLEYGLASKGSPFARTDMSLHSKEEIHERIRQIQERQNELDRSRDLVDQQNSTKTPQSGQEVLEKLRIEKKDIPDAIKTLLRALESLRSSNAFDKVSTSLSSPRRSSTWPISRTDAHVLRLQDRESIERDIQALKAAYSEPVPTLPSWTITKFEIDLGDVIGRGFFSTVYKGKWATRIVAVKVLEVYTSKETFVDEVNLWKKLDHPNVLQLYGASSVEKTVPWFLVSPLMEHGSIADYLKRMHWDLQRHKESGITAPEAGHERVDFLRIMHDIAEGMRYLHEHGVYHGDLKVFSEDLRCVVSDFGLSKWIHQLEQKSFLPNHALRWQAPELMAGDSTLTKKADVYAFAMCCIEIVTMGSIPWPTMKDDDVRQHVLDEEGRPPYPANLVRDLKFENLLHLSWHQSPSRRPSFKQLVRSLQILRDEVMIPDLVLSSPRVVIFAPAESPDPNSLLRSIVESPVDHVPEDPINMSPRAEYSTPFIATLTKLDSETEVPFHDGSEKSPLDELSININFGSSSEKPPGILEEEHATVKEPYEDQFEHTYRMCLSHEFPRQLNFPLWTPGDVELGDVGFLSRSGQFIKLFNSIQPSRSSGGRMKIPRIGNISVAVRQQKDNFMKKGFKAISKLVSAGESGSKYAYKVCVTATRLSDNTPVIVSNIDTLSLYLEVVPRFSVLRKRIIDTFKTPDHANNGFAHFDVFTSPGNNEPWGAFILPSDQPNAPQRFFFPKVSKAGSPSKAILVARLRFQTDVEEPTLMSMI
ncbi:hypothetical protein C0995_006694 [Termitomyces sp. Mi166|nr:hypothetical protein C0995_006694 [Termitomyces sp. Mi166\